MLNQYRDIIGRIAENPSWFDRNGVPRYGAFHPSACPNIYAHEAVLFEIECQRCGQRFKVATERDRYETNHSLKRAVELRTLCFGDPPCFGCLAGATMSSIPRRTLQFWRRGDKLSLDWERVPALENVRLDEEDGDDA